jgi:hypothetical protein
LWKPGSDPVVGDPFFLESIKGHFKPDELPAVQDALRIIHEGIHTAVSIDAFIHRFQNHRYVPYLGKALIVLEIMKAEHESSMSPENWPKYKSWIAFKSKTSLHLPDPDTTWIGQFMRILLDGVEDFNEIGRDLNIICFNYDRCIEYYLIKSIAAAYSLSEDKAYEIVKNINIIHPYGQIGELPHFTTENKPMLEFGARLDRKNDIFEFAKGIRTYAEQAHDPGNVRGIHDAIAYCELLVFLGFGFNNQNLDLLRIQNVTGYDSIQQRPIFSSGTGIAPQVEDTLRRRILALFMPKRLHLGWKSSIQIEFDQTCSSTIGIHSMNLGSFISRVVSDDGSIFALSEREAD